MKAAGYERDEHDWYVEPDWLVDALIAKEAPFTGRVWDPFCGQGTIPLCLSRAGVDVVGTDLVDRGHGLCGVDFFTSAMACTSIVSNPPFIRLEDAARRALSLCPAGRVALLGRLGFLEGQSRGFGLWQETPLARVWVSMRRASMPPGGRDIKAEGGKTPYAWFVWQHDHVGEPRLGWL